MEAIEQFLRNSMNGEDAINGCRHALRWLSSGERLFAHEQDGVWKATRLGQAAIRGSLPLPMACGIASLMRDIMSVDPTDAILRHMSKLDLLLLLELLASRPMLRKTFSEKLAEQIDQGFAAVPVLHQIVLGVPIAPGVMNVFVLDPL